MQFTRSTPPPIPKFKVSHKTNPYAFFSPLVIQKAGSHSMHMFDSMNFESLVPGQTSVAWQTQKIKS